MCVIVLKPKDHQIPTTILKNMWDKNPHGAGFAFIDGKKIIFRKGFMSFKPLQKALNYLDHKELVIHFRLATHGAVCPKNCHPFELSKNIEMAQSTTGVADAVLFHNGVLYNYGSKHLSDTLEFTSRCLSHIPKDNRSKLLSSLNGKYALLQDGKINLIGQFQDYEKLKVSNTFFAPYKPIIWNSVSYRTSYNTSYSTDIPYCDDNEYLIPEFNSIKRLA